MAATAVRVTGRSLAEPVFFERLIRRVMTKNGIARELAVQVTDQIFAYLATCAQKPAGSPTLYMSPAVDMGWHAFLEYTREYDQFFDSHGWPKVHHNPCDSQGVAYPPAATVLPLTVEAIERAGYVVLPELWQDTRVDCEDTCGDDGVPGNPPDCGHAN
jgi:hypothetical protein